MNPYDAQMLGILGLMLMMSGIAMVFLKELIAPFAVLYLLLFMIWGDDVCSRTQRVDFYGEHFTQGGEIICHDNRSQILLISKERGWVLKGEYLFKANQGISVLHDTCEIQNRSEPHCISVTTQIIIGGIGLLGIFGYMIWLISKIGRINAINLKTRENKDDDATQC